MKTARIIGFVISSIVLGNVIANIFIRLPYQMQPVIDVTQWVMHFFDPENVHNPDAFYDFAEIFYAIASTLIAGALIYIAWRIFKALHNRSHA